VYGSFFVQVAPSRIKAPASRATADRPAPSRGPRLVSESHRWGIICDREIIAPNVGDELIPEIEDGEIHYEIDVRDLRVPTVFDVEEGFGDIRDYQDLVGVSWEAAQCLDLERSLLAGVIDQATTPREFGELGDQALGNYADEVGDLGPQGIYLLDLGVLGLTATLSAAGCAPASSCGGHGTAAPYIRFAADPQRVRILLEIARIAGCGLTVDEGGLLQTWAPSIKQFLRFAGMLVLQQEKFVTLPEMKLRDAEDEEDRLSEDELIHLAEAEARRPGKGQLRLFYFYDPSSFY
jgi:hypothetical protein